MVTIFLGMEDYFQYKKGWLRKSLNALIFASFAIGIYYFLSQEHIFGFNYLVVSPALLFAPRLFYNHLKFHKYFSLKALATVELLAMLIFVTAVLDAVWLYKVLFYFDWFVHFIAGTLVALLIFLTLLFFEKKYQRVFVMKLILLAMILGGAVLAGAWELFEYLNYPSLKIATFGDLLVPAFTDTILDFISNSSGSALLGFLVLYYGDKAKSHFTS